MRKIETFYMHSITGMSWNELQAVSPRVANLVDVIRAAATDDELKAMYTYLHSLPAVASPVK